MTAETRSGVGPAVLPIGEKVPWPDPPTPTLLMHDLVQVYLDAKGIDYCIELKFFMLDIEG